MAGFLDVCRFTPTAGGTTDWTFSVAVTGYQSPTAAGAVNGRLYKYRAESADLSQWEIGEGAYNSATGVFARTTVLFNSAGTTAKINFTAPPQVAIVALKEDLLAIEEANSFTTTQQGQARSNIAAFGVVKVQKFTASGTYTPSAGMVYCIIECIAGGGGGGGAVCTTTTSQYAGGGGGGGGYARKIATVATIGASQSVTIGVGGAGGAGAVNGSGGGSTSVGALCSAGGGGGGFYGNVGQQGSGGGYGSGIAGDSIGYGSPGCFGEYYQSSSGFFFQSGQGGSSVYGGGALGQIASGSAANGFGGAANSGGGGSGGIVAALSASATGGAGAAGLVIITEFCTQ